MSGSTGLDPASARALRDALLRLGGDGLIQEIKAEQQKSVKELKSAMVAEYRANPQNRGIRVDKFIKIGRFRFNKKRGLAWGAVGIARGDVEFSPATPTRPAEVIKAWRASRRIEEGYSSDDGPVPAAPFMRPAYERVGPPAYQRVIDVIRRFLERRGG